MADEFWNIRSKSQSPTEVTAATQSRIYLGEQMQNEKSTCDMFTFISQNEKAQKVKKREMTKGHRLKNQTGHSSGVLQR